MGGETGERAEGGGETRSGWEGGARGTGKSMGKVRGRVEERVGERRVGQGVEEGG